LLHDQKAVYDDQLDSVRRASRNRLDFALITDGLRAEREQGITIDVAYRYFATPRRRFIVADTPGHDQYTRNMVTGASTAEAAILLMDVTRGLLPQTNRHAYLSWMLGIRHFCVAINKMDAVAFGQEQFERLREQFLGLVKKMPGCTWTFIPVSALEGDNVVHRSGNMRWYQGPTLLEYLETVNPVGAANSTWLRLPVQAVIRGPNGERRYAGRLTAGSVACGDEVLVLPSNQRAHVVSLGAPDPAVQSAFAPMSVALSVTEHVDVSRGDMIVDPTHPPAVSRRFIATLFWMGYAPLAREHAYEMKHTTHRVPAEVARVISKLEVDTIEQTETDTVAANDIARVSIETRRPIYCDPYAEAGETGSFILIDPQTNETVAAGTIERIFLDHGRSAVATPGRQAAVVWLTGLSSAGKTTLAEQVFDRLRASGHKVELLDGDLVRQRLSKGLGYSKEDRDENIRRIGFVAELLARNGVTVIVSAISPYRALRAEVRRSIPSFVEVYVNAPLEVCEGRDVKGLYRRARAGELHGFTGVDDPYEAPLQPEVECRTDLETVEESGQKILDYLSGLDNSNNMSSEPRA
jgi:bifunctional enzyme CysN/CysC